MVTSDQLLEIRKQVSFHSEFITDLHRVHDYSFVKLFDPHTGKLTTPPDLMRRGNDFLAAAYVHALAIDAPSGDDCIDINGRTVELKLAYIKKDSFTINSVGSLTRKSDASSSLAASLTAKFRVYKGTDIDHHKKDTAFILMSHDHNCFITGFVLPGETVKRLLTEGGQNSVQRTISLAAFMKYGYEINSSVPNIGWDRYHNALRNIVAAQEGKIVDPANNPSFIPFAGQAYQEWVDIGRLEKLQKLEFVEPHQAPQLPMPTPRPTRANMMDILNRVRNSTDV